MFDMEEKILESLSYDGNILEEESIVQTISTSKQQTNEINEKQAVADVTEKQVDAARLAYTPIAIHCTVLYFTIGMLFSTKLLRQIAVIVIGKFLFG